MYNDAKLRPAGAAGYYINLPFISVDTFDANNVGNNVVELAPEVFYDDRNPSTAGGDYYIPVTTAVKAGDVGTVFAFTVILLKNFDVPVH